MFDAQILIAGSSSYSIYSPWFSRGGDNLRASAQILVGDANISVHVFTKNSEDVGNGMDVNSNVELSLTTPGSTVVTAEWGPNTTSGSAGGLEELVRYKYTVTGTAGTSALFRMLSPVWFDTINA